jgi:hypothetical protein
LGQPRQPKQSRKPRQEVRGIVNESLFMIELDQTSRRIGTTETTETIEGTEEPREDEMGTRVADH